MEIRIEDAQPCHLEEMEKIEKRCFSMPWTLDQLRSQLKDAQHECIAALDENGRVLGLAPHEQLIETCAEYRAICRSQIGGGTND